MVNSLTASSYCITILVSMYLTEFRRNWMFWCDGRHSDSLDLAPCNCHKFKNFNPSKTIHYYLQMVWGTVV